MRTVIVLVLALFWLPTLFAESSHDDGIAQASSTEEGSLRPVAPARAEGIKPNAVEDPDAENAEYNIGVKSGQLSAVVLALQDKEGIKITGASPEEPAFLVVKTTFNEAKLRKILEEAGLGDAIRYIEKNPSVEPQKGK